MEFAPSFTTLSEVAEGVEVPAGVLWNTVASSLRKRLAYDESATIVARTSVSIYCVEGVAIAASAFQLPPARYWTPPNGLPAAILFCLWSKIRCR